MNLENKIALITGSTRGIGKSIAQLFAKNNATVIICGRNIESSKKTIEELSTELNINKDKFFPLELDISNKESIKNAVDTVINKYKKIDVLINNAGITSNVSLLESTDEEFFNMFNINFFGVVTLTREVVKYMKETGGSIINTSSMVGTYGGRNQSAYASSKFAINGLTKSLAKELGNYNIRVNAVAPGVVETDMMSIVSEEMKVGLKRMIPLNRLANPDELAGAYLYLASDLSKYTTGTIINVDGGIVM
jgi:3-oxoacyl-[acyl-carrier protein] reductase/7-alpha-hydroxysteroid dehydrogenase